MHIVLPVVIVVVVAMLVIVALVKGHPMYAMHTMVGIVPPTSGTALVTAGTALVPLAASTRISVTIARQRGMQCMSELSVPRSRELHQLRHSLVNLVVVDM